MSSIIDKAKSKLSGSSNKNQGEEQQFTIQPHPAKTNDPADLQRDPAQMGPGSGLGSQPEVQAHHARGPYVPSKDIVNSLEHPASREELAARTKELNSGQ